MKWSFSIILLFVFSYSWGQTDSTLLKSTSDSTLLESKIEVDLLEQLAQPDSTGEGSVRIEGDPRVQQLLRLNKSVRKQENSFVGYRIQLLSRASANVDMEALQQFSQEFVSEFPDIPIYVQYLDPDFKKSIKQLS